MPKIIISSDETLTCPKDHHRFALHEGIARQTMRKYEKELERRIELENQKTLDRERKNIEDREREKSRLEVAGLKKRLDDAQRLNTQLTQKLEQGSQQLQGEVLELELERLLRSAFPYDKIEPVPKGVRGADILHRVCTPTGQLCGTIIWEAKRPKTKRWSDKWIHKLKDDQMRAGAEIAIIVSTFLPKDSKDPFMMHGDVWVASDAVVRPIAETLRAILLQSSKLKLANTGKTDKMELLYNYLCSPQFAQRVRSVFETFISMKRTLDREKNAMARLWKQREGEIERVKSNMRDMCGELQSISQSSLHQLEQIEQLSLPTGEVDKS